MTTPVLDVADFLGRSYSDPPCWELVTDVYTSVLGEPTEDYKTVSTSVRSLASVFRLALHKSSHGFEQIAEPRDFAVVLMGRTKKLGVHHAGVFYDGKVLHAMTSESGQVILHQDLPSILDEWKVVEFWAK